MPYRSRTSRGTPSTALRTGILPVFPSPWSCDHGAMVSTGLPSSDAGPGPTALGGRSLRPYPTSSPTVAQIKKRSCDRSLQTCRLTRRDEIPLPPCDSRRRPTHPSLWTAPEGLALPRRTSASSLRLSSASKPVEPCGWGGRVRPSPCSHATRGHDALEPRNYFRIRVNQLSPPQARPLQPAWTTRGLDRLGYDCRGAG
jgi:hypothetical protein